MAVRLIRGKRRLKSIAGFASVFVHKLQKIEIDARYVGISDKLIPSWTTNLKTRIHTKCGCHAGCSLPHVSALICPKTLFSVKSWLHRMEITQPQKHIWVNCHVLEVIKKKQPERRLSPPRRSHGTRAMSGTAKEGILQSSQVSTLTTTNMPTGFVWRKKFNWKCRHRKLFRKGNVFGYLTM